MCDTQFYICAIRSHMSHLHTFVCLSTSAWICNVVRFTCITAQWATTITCMIPPKIWANVHWTFQVFLFSFVKNFVTPKDWVATIPYVINCWDGNRKIVEIFTWILVTLHDTRYPIVSLVAVGWSRG